MMMDCPKCGFNQPKDRYCANCGVDMERFEKAPQPLHKQAMESPKAQAFIIVGAIFTLVTFIYISQKQRIDQTIAKVVNSTPATEEEESVDEKTPKAFTLNAQKATPTTAPTQAPTQEETKVWVPSKLEFSFAEVPSSFVEELQNLGSMLNETANTRSIFFPYTKSLADLQFDGIQPYFLPGSESSNITAGESIRLEHIQFAEGYSSELGLMIEIEIQSIDAEKMEMELRATLNLPEGDGQVDTTEFIGRYKWSTAGVLAIVGLVPQQSLQGEVAEVLSNTPLSIMSSPDFVARSTEFVLFIKPK